MQITTFEKWLLELKQNNIDNVKDSVKSQTDEMTEQRDIYVTPTNNGRFLRFLPFNT